MDKFSQKYSTIYKQQSPNPTPNPQYQPLESLDDDEPLMSSPYAYNSDQKKMIISDIPDSSLPRDKALEDLEVNLPNKGKYYFFFINCTLKIRHL